MNIRPKKSQWVSPTARNPLVAKLNLIRDKQAFMSQVELRQDRQFDFNGVDARERKRIFGSEFYAPSDFAWEIYKAISEMIEFGYRFKNIAYPSFYADMNKAALECQKRAEGEIEADKKIDMGGCIIGPAGLGKSETVNRAVDMLPATILHPASDTAYQKSFLQIPCIKADINGRSTLSVLQNLLAVIDDKIGTTYYEDNPQRKGEGYLIEVVANACWQHAVGLVILDEGQMLITESGKASGKDSPNAKFLQRLFNALKVPILLIGTPELEDFLSCNAHTLRRYKKDADITLDNYPQDSDYWEELVITIIQQYVFCREVVLTSACLRQIHVYTAGNYSALQIYCKAMIEHVEESNITCLSEKLLKDVYELKKSVLNKLTRLHKKPIQEISFKVPKLVSKNTNRAVPMPNDQSPDSVAMHQSKELGRAAHDLFRKG
ncbi:ATP-binding protein [Alteromonas stellipolaris]|uniref:ATP-binding protein n=1 Tax=Alteromonas stellipolaris TaxID=233316 RepID=UPI0026E2BDBB|nr:ATP-binding protein [Alteromonas stellipolaris]MDO6536263.1 ATP-binding protein [Alteromonas stellipolaris]MDO6627798.1 ATP-binding protein [Alteromonas stellipolaris]